MLNPVWLNSFITVSDCRNFTAAGNKLGLKQSSVSDHVRHLEEAVGRRLFVRDTHSVSLTPDGESMLVHAKLILDAMRGAELQFRAPRLQGRVRLGTSDDLALGPLPTVLTAFRKSHPDVELELIIGMTGRLYELLDAGSLDLLIGKRRDGDRRGTRLFKGKMEWICKAGTVLDLSQPLPLVLAAEPSVSRGVVLDTLAKAGLRWDIVCTSSSHSGCLAAARGGLGVTVFASYLRARGLAPPLNVANLPPLPDSEFISLSARRLSRPAQTLLELLHQTDLSAHWLEG
jgi:DNA-binding transcriptional LysR family regulator